MIGNQLNSTHSSLNTHRNPVNNCGDLTVEVIGLIATVISPAILWNYRQRLQYFMELSPEITIAPIINRYTNDVIACLFLLLFILFLLISDIDTFWSGGKNEVTVINMLVVTIGIIIKQAYNNRDLVPSITSFHLTVLKWVFSNHSSTLLFYIFI